MVEQGHAVRAVNWFGPEVFELVLERDGFDFTVGDCVALFNADNVSRPYSIASGQSEDVLRFVIRRMEGGAVSAFLASCNPGERIKVSKPFGWFRPGVDANGSPFMFVATGTGIAPFLAYLRTRPERPPAQCLYGIRKLEDVAELDFLQSSCNVTVAVSREDAQPHVRGRVTDVVDDIELAPDMHVYLCGLDAMIDDVTERLEARGVDFSRIHTEVFFHATP